MRILVLDLSLSTGWSWLEGDLGAPENAKLLDKGVTKLPRGDVSKYGDYPENYRAAAESMADHVLNDAYYANNQAAEGVDAIIVEEINLGKSRYSQKILDMLHYCILKRLATDKLIDKVRYIDSSQWRKAIGLVMSKDQKKANAILSKAKKDAEAAGTSVDKKALGIKKKINKKDLALYYANARFGLELRAKDDDIADALCIGCAFFAGAQHCDGH